MTQPIPAIPTFYNGVQYRSRTEARTAVFFDYFGIRHEYEPRKYHLNGIVYIPDFWLTDYKLWVETKGQKPTDREREKARRLFYHEGYPVFIVSGVPYAIERESFSDEVVEDEYYDHTGLAAYSGLLFAKTYEVVSRDPPARMSVEQYIVYHQSPVELINESYDELTNTAWVYCAECERLCIGEYFYERGREWYMPILGCSRPFRHVAEIELLDWKMKQAYEAARTARFE